MADEKRPEWMTSISSLVDPDEYLLGRKIDKTFELSQKEKADRAKEARIELLAKDKIKLSHDPMLDLERRKQQLKMELINNPVMMKQFRDKLLKGEHSGQSGRDRRDHKDERSRNSDRDHSDNDRNDRRHRHDHHRTPRNREEHDEHRASGSRSSGVSTDESKQSSSRVSYYHTKKGKVQVHGAKPEMPAFLQRIKEQIVANEDNERKMMSEKRRRERSNMPTHEDDEPAVVKLNDDDLTEAEYKRLKKELETQYKIPGCEKANEKHTSKDLDIDQFIKSRPRSHSSRDDRKTTTHRSRDHRQSHEGEPSRARNSPSHGPSREDTSSKRRKVLSYGSSSDDSD